MWDRAEEARVAHNHEVVGSNPTPATNKVLVVSKYFLIFVKQNKKVMEQEIKVGDFISGQYRYGCIQGIVQKVLKDKVVIKRCNQWFNKYTLTSELVNVTKSRITRVGLNDNETLVTE